MTVELSTLSCLTLQCALPNLLFLLHIAATGLGKPWYEEEWNISRTFAAWFKLPMSPVVSMAPILSPSKGGEMCVNFSTVLCQCWCARSEDGQLGVTWDHLQKPCRAGPRQVAVGATHVSASSLHPHGCTFLYRKSVLFMSLLHSLSCSVYREILVARAGHKQRVST